MMNWFWKRKWMALGLIVIMLFTLLPTRWNWADSAVTKPTVGTEESEADTEADVSTEISTESVGTEALTQDIIGEESGTLDSSTEFITEEPVTIQKTATEMDTTEMDATETVTTGEKVLKDEETEEKEEYIISKMAVEETGSERLLDNNTFDLSSMELSATYIDENNQTQNVTLNNIDSVSLPIDATIGMYFKFVFHDGNQIEVGKEYVYTIPDEIRVDVDKTHELESSLGGSIGEVHISKDGTLTFIFNDTVTDQVDIPFFVRFEGGFSSDSDSALGEKKISFPTAGGSFDYNVNITDSNEDTDKGEPGELGVQKSGSKTVVNINGKTVPVIQWEVSLDLNGRDTVTADITDSLPAGLTYAAVPGYPQLSGGSKGAVTSTSKDGATDISIHVADANAYYRTNVTFYTYYDNDIFSGTQITNNSGVTVNNSVTVNEDGGDSPVSGTGSCYVAPKVLSKSGSESDGVITWTVTINQDQLNVGGTVYQDSFGAGYSWADAGKHVTIQPSAAGSITSSDENGFTFIANNNVKDTITLTYQTKISDYTQSQYKNSGTLTGDNFNASATGTVKGYNLLSKSNTSYNEVTKQLTWRIAVNEQGYDFGSDSVTVKDIYNVAGKYQNQMELVSMTVTDADGNVINTGYTKNDAAVTFKNLGKDKRYITVVTRILDEKNTVDNYTWQTQWQDKDWVIAYNQAELDWDGKKVTADASKLIQYRAPQLMSKDGTIEGDGTIEWVIRYNYLDMAQKEINIEDVIPEGLVYVAGSMQIMENSWSTSSSFEPEITGNKMTIHIDDNSSALLKSYLNRSFEIHYKTKANDLEAANTRKEYTNQATAAVTYEGDIKVTDEASKTVTGELGGTLGKEAYYQNGNDYVDWTVTINENGYTMNVKNPVIRDHLESYFDYVDNSAKLYRIKNGSRTEVTDFSIAVVNNDMVVALPDIADETYEFSFRTKFNVTPAQAAALTVKNSVSLEGSAYQESVTSNEVKNVNFSSSSAGAYFERELRVKKVDKDGKALAGATFALYYKNNYVTSVTTGDEGYAVFKGVNSNTAGYTYVLKETNAPDGYEKLTDDIEVVITDDKFKTENTGVRYYEETITNVAIDEDVSTDFSVYKTDEKNAALAGAEFTVYSDAACTKSVAVKTTDASGLVSYTVEYSKTAATNYYVKETVSPDGYKEADSNAIYHISIDTNGKVSCVDYNNAPVSLGTVTGKSNVISISNEKTKASFVISKKDAENGSISVPGATYTLYSDSECRDEVTVKTTDQNGKIEFSDLTPGHTYYYRETSAPEGYLLDEEKYSITIGTGKEHKDVSAVATVQDKKASGYIQITKTDDTVDANKIANVVFKLYREDGTTPYPNQTNQLTAKTDSSGIAVFSNLPFGTYVVKEEETPAGYVAETNGKKVVVNSETGSKVTFINKVTQFNLKVIKQDDGGNPLSGVLFTVKNKSTGEVVTSGETKNDGTITFSNLPYDDYTVTETRGLTGYTLDSTPQDITANEIQQGKTIEKVFVNEKQNASIQFRKRDSGDKSVYLAGAEFSVYNSAGEFVKTVTSSSDHAALGQVLITDLIYDTYTIKETKAPNKYQLDTKEWKVTVNENAVYTLEYGLLTNSNEMVVDNSRLPGEIKFMSFKIFKSDEEDNPLPGAKFTLSKKFEGGDYEVAATAYSDQNGIVEFYNITVDNDPETTMYKVEEVEAPTGYRIGEDYYKEYTYSQLPAATYEGKAIGHQNMKETFEDVPNSIYSFKNTQLQGSIRVTKKGTDTLSLLSGAEFVLYKYDAAKSKYDVYQKDGADYVTSTDQNGIAIFEDLPYGTYMVKEIKAPKGYILNALNQQTVSVNADTQGAVQIDFVDAPIEVLVYKFAVGGSEQILGAALELYEKEDVTLSHCLKSWVTTSTAQRLDSSVLEAGKTYVIHEKTAPAGYFLSEDVCFKVNEDGTISYVSGEDGSVSGKNVIVRDRQISLTIFKLGLEGEDVKNLSGALISLIDDASGKEVYSFTSTTIAQTVSGDKLSVSQEGYHYYTIHEKSAPGGYALAEDVKIAVGANGKIYLVKKDGGLGAELVNQTVTMTDEKYENFYFAKNDASTGEMLAGAKFSIKDKSGKEIANWISSGVPQNVTLEVGEGYVLTEETAPAGYKLQDPITFNIVEGDPYNYIQVTDGSGYRLSSNFLTLTSLDERITVRFVKWNENYEPLSGGVFELHSSDAAGTIGEQLCSFKATGETMTLDNSNFVLGGYYVIIEKEAPSNYEVTEPVYFHIDENGEAEDLSGNKIESNLIVFIDGKRQVSFQKVDSVTGKMISGVQLKISSEDGKDVIDEWTTNGSSRYLSCDVFEVNKKYILEEIATANGYSYADAIYFQIDEQGSLYIDNKKQASNVVTMRDDAFSVYVDKRISGTDTSLSGATLQVTDEDGKILEQWTSNGKIHALDVSKLQVSREKEEHVYTLSEVKAPEWYGAAQPISFTIDQAGNVVVNETVVEDNTIVMYDEYNVVSFSKTDLGGKAVPGATLSINSDEDTEFTTLTWKSTDKPMNYARDLFKPNVTYVLTEQAAPDGYACAKSISFKIDGDGILYVNGTAVDGQTVTMVDNVLQLLIAKKDSDGDELLAGAELSIILESSQKIIHNMTSGKQTIEIPSAKLTASTDTQKVVYILRENKAPKGYEMAEDVRFYINSAGQIFVINQDDTETLAEDNIVSMYDEKSDDDDEDEEDGDQSRKTTSKKTGDTSQVEVVLVLMYLSIAGLGTMIFIKKKKDKNFD